MARLWNLVDERKLSIKNKTRLFLLLNSFIYSASGLFAWAVISKFALESLDWAICFAGYPGFFAGFIGGYIFLCQK